MEGSPHLGRSIRGVGADPVFLLNAQGGVIHSAVYIADDVVFREERDQLFPTLDPHA
jgi:hypothetical protein